MPWYELSSNWRSLNTFSSSALIKAQLKISILVIWCFIHLKVFLMTSLLCLSSQDWVFLAKRTFSIRRASSQPLLELLGHHLFWSLVSRKSLVWSNLRNAETKDHLSESIMSPTSTVDFGAPACLAAITWRGELLCFPYRKRGLGSACLHGSHW